MSLHYAGRAVATARRGARQTRAECATQRSTRAAENSCLNSWKREGRDCLQTALDLGGAIAESSVRGRALAPPVCFLAVPGHLAEVNTRLEGALAISREIGDDAAGAFALRYLGFCALAVANFDTARIPL
jgi:hypothetical protein